MLLRGLLGLTGGLISTIILFVWGVIQFFAIQGYFVDVLNWNHIIGFIAALLLAGVPILGPILGVIGATQGWGWGLVPALLLFFGQYLFFAFTTNREMRRMR